MASLTRKSFTENYIQDAFIHWYLNGKPSANRLASLLGEIHPEKIPHPNTINTWIEKFDWISKGYELDGMVADRLEADLVSERVEMLQRHIQTGRNLQEQALAYFEEHGIKRETTALKMLDLGVQLERTSSELPKLLTRVSKMSNDEILNRISRLTGRIEEDAI